MRKRKLLYEQFQSRYELNFQLIMLISANGGKAYRISLGKDFELIRIHFDVYEMCKILNITLENVSFIEQGKMIVSR